jgi:hypothetical protein
VEAGRDHLRLHTHQYVAHQGPDERSGFDEKTFVVRFEAAGGIWLNLDQTAYHTYDGSHLREDAAVELSGDVARLMRPSLVSAGK